MKKTKSIFALLITLSLILGTVVVPVQAADKIVIKAQDYSQDIVPAGAFAVSERAFTVGSDCEVTYDIIAPQAGNYHVTANMCTPFEEPVSARTGVGDKLHYTVIQTKSTTFQDFYVGTFKLEKGKNYLSFGSELGESFLLKFFELEFDGGRAAADFQKKDGPYKNHYLPGRIQAEDFDIGEDGHGSEEGHTFKEPYRGATKIAVESVGTKYMVTLHDKEWAKYTFNVTQSGSYDVGLEVGYGDAMEIYFDGSDGCFSATTERHGGSTTFGTVPPQAVFHMRQ